MTSSNDATYKKVTTAVRGLWETNSSRQATSASRLAQTRASTMVSPSPGWNSRTSAVNIPFRLVRSPFYSIADLFDQTVTLNSEMAAHQLPWLIVTCLALVTGPNSVAAPTD